MFFLYSVYTSFPLTALTGVYRGAIFLLVLAMGLGALVKNELIAAIICGGLGFFILILTMDDVIARWSPFFDPLLAEETGPTEILAWSIQNYIGFSLVTLGLAALAFSRAERREQLLE